MNSSSKALPGIRSSTRYACSFRSVANASPLCSKRACEKSELPNTTKETARLLQLNSSWNPVLSSASGRLSWRTSETDTPGSTGTNTTEYSNIRPESSSTVASWTFSKSTRYDSSRISYSRSYWTSFGPQLPNVSCRIACLEKGVSSSPTAFAWNLVSPPSENILLMLEMIDSADTPEDRVEASMSLASRTHVYVPLPKSSTRRVTRAIVPWMDTTWTSCENRIKPGG